jgi:ABC-type cobalamin/Fe3+-siderophores transport system ATPase subunit
VKITSQKLSLVRGERKILDGLTLTLQPGRITGIIGPNGAGKSTFLQAVNGMIADYEGEIRLGDHDLRSFSAAKRALLVTYVGAELETDFPLTTAELVSLGTYAMGDEGMTPAMVERMKTVMEETGCWDYRDRSIAGLSSGERQRAHLARALVQGSKWICLDESFSRLDLHHQARIGALLRKYLASGISFLFVSHDLNFTTDWADHCVLIREGKIIAEGPTAETVDEKNLRALYPDAEIVLTPHPVTGAMKVYFRG